MGILRSRCKELTFILNYYWLIPLPSGANMMVAEDGCSRQVQKLSKTEGREEDLSRLWGSGSDEGERKRNGEEEEDKEGKEERETLKKSTERPLLADFIFWFPPSLSWLPPPPILPLHYHHLKEKVANSSVSIQDIY